MAKGLDTGQLRQRLAQVRRDQDELLNLPEAEFRKVCWDIAAMRREPVSGLLERLRLESAAGELFRVDPRITALRRAEQMVVDQLDREQLILRLRQGRLTRHMCDYWLRRRPKEVPRINGMPLWLAVFSADIAG